ncbi:hypothetical protein EVAR_77978_1 [Eumeta japonica]|uniref:Uncharacterized protein n=1 Tax=Eumeta variegata TaxID=151549 RepID=A0A4C1T2V2_EUMVA|nr:hypothetical protein EVAR_77978_1 [Eumeta japonica]
MQRSAIEELWNDLASALFPVNFDKEIFKKGTQFFLKGRQRASDSSGVAGAHGSYRRAIFPAVRISARRLQAYSRDIEYRRRSSQRMVLCRL